MLIGTFAFPKESAKNVKTVNLNEAIELIENSLSYEVIEIKFLLDCLLTITFVFQDGSTETREVLVEGVSCSEI